MSFFAKERPSSPTRKAPFLFPRFLGRKRLHKRPRKSVLFWPAMLPLIIVSGLLVNWIFLSQDVYAAPLAPTAQGGHLTFQQFASEGQQSKAPHGAFVRPPQEKPKKIPHPQAATLPGAEPATMKLITQVLSSTQTDATMVGASGIKPLDFLSSMAVLRFRCPQAPSI
jgi:hypothetical protein